MARGLVDKARKGKLTADDFAGTTVSLTNPGGIGTVHSVPRLMKGQGCIIGAGTLMVCLPLMLAFILFQKQFLRSFGFSGIK